MLKDIPEILEQPADYIEIYIRPDCTEYIGNLAYGIADELVEEYGFDEDYLMFYEAKALDNTILDVHVVCMVMHIVGTPEEEMEVFYIRAMEDENPPEESEEEEKERRYQEIDDFLDSIEEILDKAEELRNEQDED